MKNSNATRLLKARRKKKRNSLVGNLNRGEMNMSKKLYSLIRINGDTCGNEWVSEEPTRYYLVESLRQLWELLGKPYIYDYFHKGKKVTHTVEKREHCSVYFVENKEFSETIALTSKVLSVNIGGGFGYTQIRKLSYKEI